MKVIGSAPLVARRAPATFFFCCHLGPRGRERFNFRAAIRGPRMQNALTWSPPVAVLAASILLRSHPEWPGELGPVASLGRARRLSRIFAAEYLIPNAGRAWIISSSTVREFVTEALSHSEPQARNPSESPACRGSNRLCSIRSREVVHGSV